MSFIYFQFGLVLGFFLSLETVVKYTPLSHIALPAVMLGMLRLRFGLTYTHTYAGKKKKKSPRVQLAMAFASEVKANQKLTTVLATEGSSVFWITSSNWS